MNFVMQWLDAQLKDFSKRISEVFVKKDEIEKYEPKYEFIVDENGDLYYREKQEGNNG